MKKNSLTAATVMLCAVLSGTSVYPVYAETSGDALQETVSEVQSLEPVEVTDGTSLEAPAVFLTETEDETSLGENIATGETSDSSTEAQAETGTSTETTTEAVTETPPEEQDELDGQIQLFFEGAEGSELMDKDMDLRCVAEKLLSLAGISQDVDDTDMDIMDGSGLRTVVFTKRKEEENKKDTDIGMGAALPDTFGDIAELVANSENGITLVSYTESAEIARFKLVVSGNGIMAIRNDAVELYRITYDLNGASGETRTSIRGLGDKVSYFETTPEWEGYHFLGWYDGAGDDARPVTEDTDVTGDITLYAHWEADPESDPAEVSPTEAPTVSPTEIPVPTSAPTEIPVQEFTVTLDDQNGNISTVVVEDGGTFSDFYTPVRDGYSFLGWYDNPTGGKEVTAAVITENKAFYAHWDQEGTRLSLMIVKASTGTTQSVAVNDTVLLSALASRLGYSVSRYVMNGQTLSDAVTVGEIAGTAASGNVMITAYGADGNVLGYIKVVKTGDTTFSVTLAKDEQSAQSTNVNSNGTVTTIDENANEATAKGKGEGEEVASSVKTSDALAGPLYASAASVAAGGWSVVLLLRMLFRRKRKNGRADRS